MGRIHLKCSGNWIFLLHFIVGLEVRWPGCVWKLSWKNPFIKRGHYPVLIPSKLCLGRTDTITQDLSYSTREESLQILNMAPKVILISLLCFLYENLEVMSPIDFTGKATFLMQKLLDVTKDVFCEVAFQTPSELSVIYFFPTHLRFSKKLVQLFYFFSYFWSWVK